MDRRRPAWPAPPALTGPSVSEETEAKIPVADLEPVRAALRRARAAPLGRAVEENELFDRPGGELRARGEALRLRRSGPTTRLTWKGPARFAAGAKSRREVEIEVSAADRTRELLEALGFVRALSYVTDRERWQLGTVEVSLDELPFGRFVELEGPPAEIERAARRLGLDLARATRKSYPQLQSEYERERGGRPAEAEPPWPE